MEKLFKVVCMVTLVTTSPCFAEIIFSGVPETKFEVSTSQSHQSILSEENKIKNRVTIELIDGQLIWTTRNNTVLVYRRSGIYDMFIASNGSGYVKIENSLSGNEAVKFLEHVHLGLATITYFGQSTGYRNELIR